jgi:hypothetical protein
MADPVSLSAVAIALRLPAKPISALAFTKMLEKTTKNSA